MKYKTPKVLDYWPNIPHQINMLTRPKVDPDTFQPANESYWKELDLRYFIMTKDDNNDFGFSFTDSCNVEEIKEYAQQQINAADVLKTKLHNMHSLFANLLNNLAKNPDKDIHWPDRDIKIAEIKKRIDAMVDAND